MIKELREQLIHDLETGSDGAVPPTTATVHKPWPGRVAPPCYIIGFPAGSYVAGGQTFVDYEIKADVIVLVQKSATYLEELETMVEYVLSNTVDWALDGIDTPTAFNESGMELLGTSIHLKKQSKM